MIFITNHLITCFVIATFFWAKETGGIWVPEQTSGDPAYVGVLQELVQVFFHFCTLMWNFSLMIALEKRCDIWREFESKQTPQQSTLIITHRRPQISVSGDHLRLVDIENRWKRNLWICFRCCEQSSPGGKSGLNCGESSMGGTTTTTRDQQESLEGTSTMATTKIPENADNASSRCS